MGSANKNEAVALIDKVFTTIERFAMIDRNDRILVGVSGGPDSVALLHILCSLAPSLDVKLGVAHLNHGLRPDAAEQEARLVNELAQKLDLRCHTDKIKIDREPGSIEARARQARYAFFHRVALTHGYTKIAVGHHADDNAEAVLMHLFRGSGIRGLSGIPPIRPQGIIRPLILARRKEIIAYLKDQGLAYLIDASNADLRFDRNRVRHLLIPLLQDQYNPNLVPTLLRMATLCWEEERWFESYLQPVLDQAQKHSTPNCLELQLETLNRVARPLRRRLVRQALRLWQGHLKRFGADHIEAILELACAQRATGHLDLPMGLSAQRTPNHLRFSRASTHPLSKSMKVEHPYTHTIDSPEQLPLSLNIPEADCCLKFSLSQPPGGDELLVSEKAGALFDLDQVNFPLTVRNFIPGDRLTPYGMTGTQKLKNLFIDRKISIKRRHCIPIVASGDVILCVAGIRRSAHAIISAGTRTVLRIELSFNH